MPKFKRKEEKMSELRTQIEELEILISEKRTELKELDSQIDNFELDTDNYSEQYDDMLNDCYPELFNMLPSRILNECDPTAYRCGLNDFVDSLDLSDDSDYQELTEQQTELENELDELEQELADLVEEEYLQEEEELNEKAEE